MIILLGKKILRAIYALHKLAPQKNDRIAIISRQSDHPGEDILLLREALLRQNPQSDIRVLCKTIGPGKFQKVKYLCHMIGPQMHALATSRAVVLDSYCIAVSILKHKKRLKVVQMWHAMGAFKKFGKSILDQEEGRPSRLADVLDMHCNYDQILASSQEGAQFFAEAFGYDADALYILPLPRVDLLEDDAFVTEQRQNIRKALAVSEEKQIILYAPTFQQGMSMPDILETLAKEVDLYDGYHLIVAPHPLVSRKGLPAPSPFYPQYSSLELLAACDIFVTDYSAMVFDAAVAHKPIYFLTPDLGRYQEKRGFYLDVDRDLPSQPCQTVEALLQAISESRCTAEAVRQFRERYVVEMHHCADHLARLVLEEKKI